MKLFIVSGLSGSGKSICLHILEDLGFYCIDNLPAALLPALLKELEPKHDKLAVSIDIRNAEKGLTILPSLIKQLKKSAIDCQMIFTDCHDEVIIQRYNQSHRPHPLTTQYQSLQEAIHVERQQLQPIMELINIHIDTSNLTIQQLHQQLYQQLALPQIETTLLLMSFGYKFGVPKDTDFIFDARCLPNPYWQPQLSAHTGKHEGVKKFLEQHSQTFLYCQQLANFIEAMLLQFKNNHRKNFNIGIGCTGGQHRSVYVVEHLNTYFDEHPFSFSQDNSLHIYLRHRELPL